MQFKKRASLILLNLKGIELNLLENERYKQSLSLNKQIYHICIINGEFNFYISGNLVKNCQDIFNSNDGENFTSIFQIPVFGHVLKQNQNFAIIN